VANEAFLTLHALDEAKSCNTLDEKAFALSDAICQALQINRFAKTCGGAHAIQELPRFCVLHPFDHVSQKVVLLSHEKAITS
jgi:hypothetical protein